MVGIRKRIALIASVIVLGSALTLSTVFAANEHVVSSGDTLSEIAAWYGMTVEDLIALNGIGDPDLIVTGQVLYLASGSGGGGDDGVVVADTVSYGSDTSSSPDSTPWTSDGGNVSDTPWWTDSVWSSTPPWYDSAQIGDLLWDAAVRYGWDPNLIMAQAWQESNWRQDEVSWTGAVGVMQIMPATAGSMNAWYFGMELDQWTSVYDNIETGVAYLSVLYAETGSVELALASYYQGWGSLQRDGWFPDTEEYVSRIMMFRDQFATGQLP